MAKIVIDGFEVIEIGHDDGARHSGSARGGDHLVGAIFKAAAIEQARQRIGL
ncbi:hypothetical protein D9M68_957720 [compost metagenome]